MARCWLIALALLGLLLPGVGPLVDHHFVERHYHHGHLFLGRDGQQSVDHVHDYGLVHRHPAGGQFDYRLPDDGLVILQSNEAAGNGLVFLPGASMNADGAFDGSGSGPLLLHYSPDDLPPDEGLVGLPKKPPRG